MPLRVDSPILFLYTGWMRDYAGPAPDDPTRGNHRWLREHPHGYEAYNFLPNQGRVYGYAPIPQGISIERLGGAKADDYVDGVIVVWIARKPNTRRTVVVGWYSDARVFRNAQEPPVLHLIEGDLVFYRAETADFVLLPPDARNFPIPSNKERRGGYGMSPIWYGLPDPSFKRDVLAYLRAGGASSGSAPLRRPPRNPDPANRLAIEKFAMEHAAAYFSSTKGGSRKVIDVSRLARGWDLEAAVQSETLLIEVKGLSGSEIVVELTPNEYTQMQIGKHRTFYVLYVVTDCLRDTAQAHIFRYIQKNSRWESDEGRVFRIQPKTAAVLRAS